MLPAVDRLAALRERHHQRALRDEILEVGELRGRGEGDAPPGDAGEEVLPASAARPAVPMVTPNSNTNDSTRLNLVNGSIKAKVPTGTLPIATGMMPDASKYYVLNYVDSTITCISIGSPACKDGDQKVAVKTIPLLAG